MKKIITEFIYRLRGDYTTEKLKSMGLVVGNDFQRLHGVIIDPAHCWLINIGNNVTIAPRAHILAHDASTKRLIGYTKIGKVVIGDNVFIGAESVILPNVIIGDNVIVGAGSIVANNLECNGVYAGNPAKYICSIDEYVKKNKKKVMESPVYGEEYTLRGNIDEIKKNEMIMNLEKGVGFIE